MVVVGESCRMGSDSVSRLEVVRKGATTGGSGLGGPEPPTPQKNWTDHPNFLMKSVITVT